MPFTPRPRRPRFSSRTWFVLGAVLLLLLLGAASNGASGLLITAGLIALLTALYSLISGRRSWAAIPSRRVAAVSVAGALVVMMVGTSLAPASVDADLASTVPSAAPARSSSPSPMPAPLVFTKEDPATTTAAPDVAVVVADTTAFALLATLLVKGRAPKTGYDRTGNFGSAWLDVDRNGCDTRNDVLSRDLTLIVKSGDCRVMTGTLAGPYTGTTINFVRGQSTSALVQIDHVVALSNAWQTGGQQLTQAQRVSFANDPLNLLAVEGATNSSKGDGDTATWLPPEKSYWCAYVARQVSVKATYGLWVTAPERDAMTRILTTCPDERASTSVFAAAPAPAPAVVPVPVAVVVPDPVAEVTAPAAPEAYYKNCDAAWAAGAAPVSAGQPGYGRHLDRDGDGVGCER